MSLLTGCMAGKNFTRLANGLATNQATVYILAPTPYGPARIIRSNPGTNASLSITPDGGVTVTHGK